LLEALQALPLELQLVLELTFWESMKVADVATVLEIAESTAYARVHRATALLSQHLRDAGIVVDAKVWSVSGDTLAAWMHSIRPPDVAGMADGH
jgi:RNA polymerase sigma-70 factor (ECF subfamily)